MYGTDRSDEENTNDMYRMFANLPADVITQGVSMIHGEFGEFFRAEYFHGESNKQGGSLALCGRTKRSKPSVRPGRCIQHLNFMFEIPIAHLLSSDGYVPSFSAGGRSASVVLESGHLFPAHASLAGNTAHDSCHIQGPSNLPAKSYFKCQILPQVINIGLPI